MVKSHSCQQGSFLFLYGVYICLDSVGSTVNMKAFRTWLADDRIRVALTEKLAPYSRDRDSLILPVSETECPIFINIVTLGVSESG